MQIQNPVLPRFVTFSRQHRFRHANNAHEAGARHQPVLGARHTYRDEHDFRITSCRAETRSAASDSTIPLT